MHPPRNLGLDFIKGLLIILVILGHLIQLIIYRNTDEFWLSPIFKAIYMFHMPVFMAISGYLSAGAVLRKSLVRGVRDRGAQLILPGLFWCALIVATKLTVLSRSSGIAAGLLDFVREFTGTYWFLWAAFFSFLLVKLLAMFKGPHLWIIGASAIVFALVPITTSIAPLVRYTYPFFCLGVIAASVERRTNISRRLRSLPIFPIVVANCLCFLAWGKDTYVYNNLVSIHDGQSAKQVLLMFAGSAAASAVAMLSMLRCWEVYGATQAARFIAVELGQRTLLLYLVQGAVFRLMDFIQFGELWDLTTRIAVAVVVGSATFAIAAGASWIVHDLGDLPRLVVGASPRFSRSSDPQ